MLSSILNLTKLLNPVSELPSESIFSFNFNFNVLVEVIVEVEVELW